MLLCSCAGTIIGIGAIRNFIGNGRVLELMVPVPEIVVKGG